MYLRRISRTNKNGSSTAYLQLAHNVWDAKSKCTKAKVIHSFGREDEIDRAALKRLVESISRVLPPEEAVKVQAGAHEGTGIEYEGSRSYGGAWLLERIWERLKMPGVIAGMGNMAQEERRIFAMVANRALAPSSKLSMEEWVGQDVEIAGLREVASHQLYRAMDSLLEA